MFHQLLRTPQRCFIKGFWWFEGMGNGIKLYWEPNVLYYLWRPVKFCKMLRTQRNLYFLLKYSFLRETLISQEMHFPGPGNVHPEWTFTPARKYSFSGKTFFPSHEMFTLRKTFISVKGMCNIRQTFSLAPECSFWGNPLVVRKTYIYLVLLHRKSSFWGCPMFPDGNRPILRK